MKKYLLIVLLFLFCSWFKIYSQFEYYKHDSTRYQHRSGDFMLLGSPNVLINTPNGTQLAGGFKIQIFLSKRISLDADIVFSRDYFHLGPGLIGIPLGIVFLSSWTDPETNTSLSDLLATIVLGVLSFEHLSYHIPLINNLEISPYLSFLRYKYAYEHGIYSPADVAGEQFSFATGVQINKYFGRFVLSPYAEYDIGYKDHIPGYNFGVYCGIYFLNRIK